MGTNAMDLIRRSQGQNGRAPESYDSDLQDFLDAAADMGDKRIEAYELHERFYEGEHETQLTDRLREFLEIAGVRFSENFCEPMVDMVAERLTVTGFQAAIAGDAESDAAGDLAAWLAENLWAPNRLDEAQGTVHNVALVKGDAFGIVGWDNAAARPTFAFNPPERVRIEYADDDATHPLYAVKVWNTSEAGPSNPEGATIVRLNLYWPDRIESYFKLHSSKGKGGWAKWLDAPDDAGMPAPWPRPWTDDQGAPLGIPVIHFRNRARGKPYGRSELCGVIPQNLLLNKQVIDLVQVMDTQGWPQRWASGVGDSGSTLTTNPGDVWKATGDAKFGQFDTAPLEPLIAAIESTISRMARRTGMPLHLLTGGDAPSGESIRASEARLVKRVRDRMTSYGNGWEDAAMMAVRLARKAGALDIDPVDVALSTIWDDPESRNEKEEAETAEAYHRLGVSKQTLLARLGFDPEQEKDRRKEEAEESMGGVLVELLNGNGDRTEPDDEREPDPPGGPDE